MQKNYQFKIHYNSQIDQIEEQIQREEQYIAQLEDQYLEKTKLCGNILTGFQYYFVEKTLLVTHNQEQTIGLEAKLFSMSSKTSQVSKKFYKRDKNLNKLPGRLTRSKTKLKNIIDLYKFKEIQIEQQKKLNYLEIYDQISVQSQYNREGSLYKRPYRCEDQRKNRSENNLSDTLTDNSLSNSQTLPFALLGLKQKKVSKKPQLDKNVKRWFNRQKKKAQTIQNSQQNQHQNSEIDEIQGISTLDQLKQKIQIHKQIERARQLKQLQQSSDSCDSVDKFIKMARKIRKN